MRVLVLGAAGMLGSAMMRELSAAGDDVIASTRPGARLPDGLVSMEADLGNEAALARLIADARPDAVVNCAGIVKQRSDADDTIANIVINALLPHRLARLCADHGVRLVHIGTDCVFSGRPDAARGPRGYREQDPADPADLYGRTKLLGEATGQRCLTLRMSLIGREPSGTGRGLVEWFLAAHSPVSGYERARFNGVSTTVASRLVRQCLHENPDLNGLWHVGGQPISKLDLLRKMRDRARPELEIEAVPGPSIDRRLDPTALEARIGWNAPGWDEMLDELFEPEALSLR